MDPITLPDLAYKLKNKELKSYKLGKPGELLITDTHNKQYLLTGIKISNVGNHLQVRNNTLIVTINSVHEKRKNKLFFSIAGLIISILGIVITITMTIKQPNEDIQLKINDLKSIQSSLSKLNDYVNSQQSKLQELNQSINSLQKEKKLMENIVSIDKDKLQSYLDYRTAEAGMKAWIERIISFFSGILASLSAAYIIYFIRSKKIISENEEVKIQN